MVAFLPFLSFAVLAVASPAKLSVEVGIDDKNCDGKFARTSPSPNAIVVDASGKQPNSYPTLGGAVAALQNITDDQSIFIMPGTYTEQVRVPNFRGNLIIQGYTCDSRDYVGNKATLTNNISRTSPNITNNDQTATLRLWGDNIKVYNLNVANTFGQARKNGMALAVSAQKTNIGFYGCLISGYQDTLLANEGRQIYTKTGLIGAVDFLFSQRGIVLFQMCDITTIGPGFITANGRDAANNTSFFLINKANVTGTNGTATSYLGRPWRPYSRVVFQNSELSDVIAPLGWSTWDDVQSTANVYFKEYNNSGPGANGTRASFSSKLDKPIQAETLLGEDFKKEWWVDESYL
ncbi:pectinesterase [Colletotrichum orchidophilum]|uniref:pectinesterase n=1 Tax=Colletotrichum orchidophilum TaxID=1209926 RepID=A0A1G4AVR4_9PEZI|nr:pectinesterase [Colletotrichum orchidophilum]OHE93153.1 pectinesterase [Colletotrichum orchidophilum]